MKKVKKIFLMVLISTWGLAQELPQLNSYMFNQYLYNPASGGMYETDFNANFITRIQWAGVDGAPVTNFAWADHRFVKNSMSAGIVASYDRFGSSQVADIAGNYTYIIRLTNKLKLSFGLRAGFVSMQSAPKGMDAGDPLAVGNTMNFPKFGTGFQLYNRKFYFSVGLPDIVSLNNSKLATDYNKPFFEKNRNFVVMAGYKIKLSDAFGLYPNARMYYYPGNQNNAQFTGSLLFEITDYFWAGGSMGTDGSAALMAGTYVSSRIRFMYAYGFYTKTRPTNQIVFNTHEICLMLQLDDLFARKNKKTISE